MKPQPISNKDKTRLFEKVRKLIISGELRPSSRALTCADTKSRLKLKIGNDTATEFLRTLCKDGALERTKSGYKLVPPPLGENNEAG